MWTLFVSPTGSDEHSGLGPDEPFLTLQAAVNKACTLDTSQGPINVVVSGTVNSGCVMNGPIPGNTSGANWTNPHLVISGNGYESSIIADQTQSAAAIIALNGARISLQNIGISSLYGNGLFPSYGAMISVDAPVGLGVCAASHFHAETNGTVYITNSGYTINGGGNAHLEAVLGGFIIYSEIQKTMTVNGNPYFSTAFASIQDTSVLYCSGFLMNFVGEATTCRYRVATNGVIQTNGNFMGLFPGTQPGYCISGGQYQ